MVIMLLSVIFPNKQWGKEMCVHSDDLLCHKYYITTVQKFMLQQPLCPASPTALALPFSSHPALWHPGLPWWLQTAASNTPAGLHQLTRLWGCLRSPAEWKPGPQCHVPWCSCAPGRQGCRSSPRLCTHLAGKASGAWKKGRWWTMVGKWVVRRKKGNDIHDESKKETKWWAMVVKGHLGMKEDSDNHVRR